MRGSIYIVGRGMVLCCASSVRLSDVIGINIARGVPNMWNVVKLTDDIVPDLRPSEAVHLVHLRAKMTEDNDGRLVLT